VSPICTPIPLLIIALFLNFAVPAAWAENYEVQMLNRGEKGSMVFEPDYLKIQPGDTVIFRTTHKSHNAASIEGMVPEDYAGFQGKIDEELSVTFEEQGFYGVRCIPHYTMGQVMLIKVGEAELPPSYRTVKHYGLAKKRMQDLFERIDDGE